MKSKLISFLSICVICLTIFNFQKVKAVDPINVQEYLDYCSSTNQVAYFPKGIYYINENIILPNVSIKGEVGTIFRGVNKKGTYNVSLREISTSKNYNNVTIENIIFDNITINSEGTNHNNWTIKNNIFINGKNYDLVEFPGVKPDSNNSNGGEKAGFYIIRKNSNATISDNMFFRDETSKGRGISVYKTNDTIIEHNYFGNIDELENYQMNDFQKEQVAFLKNNYDLSLDQGFFETAINVVNEDKNMKIVNNVFNLNTDIEELHYEDKSGDTLGYNRDHIIYAKGYTDLVIAGNYFKGLPNNADGGVKVRNGSGCYIINNYFYDVPMLSYIQSDNQTQNIFQNFVFDGNLMICSSFSSMMEYEKYVVGQYAFLFMIYKESILSNFTISNNQLIVNGSINERFILNLKNYNETIDGLSILNNEIINNNSKDKIKVEFTNFLNQTSFSSTEDYTNCDTPFYPSNIEELRKYQLPFKGINEVDFRCVNGKITSNYPVYVNGELNGSLKKGANTIFIQKKSTKEVQCEDKVVTVDCYDYTYVTVDYNLDINIPNKITVSDNLELKLNGELINIKDCQVTIENGCLSYNNGIITAINAGNDVITITYQDLSISYDIEVLSNNFIDDFTVQNIELYIYETKDILLSYDLNCEVVFTISALTSGVVEIKNNQIKPLKVGFTQIQVTENNSQITKIFNVTIKNNKITISYPDYLEVNKPFELITYINGEESECEVKNLIKDDNKYYCDKHGNIIIQVIDKYNLENVYEEILYFNDYYIINNISLNDIIIGQMVEPILDVTTSADDVTYTLSSDSANVRIVGSKILGLKKGPATITIKIDGCNYEKELEINVLETNDNNGENDNNSGQTPPIIGCNASIFGSNIYMIFGLLIIILNIKLRKKEVIYDEN